MLRVIEIDQEKTWEDFCASASPTTFLQSWYWGEVHRRMGRKIWRLAVIRGAEPAAIGLLVKHRSRVGDHLYCPRGPLCDWTEPDVFDAFLLHARALAVAERCAFVRLDPLLPESGGYQTFFTARGFVRGLTIVQAEDIRVLSLVPSEAELLAGMRKTTRYLVRQETVRGISVSVSAAAAAAVAFVDLLYAMAARKRFVPQPREFYLTAFDVFSRQGLAEMFTARHGGTILAMAMIFYYADTAYYLYAASRGGVRGSFGYRLQWEAITRAKRRGCRYYNFLGVARDADLRPGTPWYGFSLFKRGFGGTEYTYLRAQDLPISRLYWIHRYAEKGRRLLRRAGRRLRRLV